MMRSSVVVLLCVLLCLAQGAGAQPSSGMYRTSPSFGGVVAKSVEAEGIGLTMEDATLRALDAAISQVNGRRVRSTQASSQAAISLDINGMRRFSASSKGFAELIVSSSNGAVRSFELLSSEEVSRTEAEQSLNFAAKGDTPWVEGLDVSLNAESKVYSHYWRVRIRAEVAKYEAPADEGKPRLAIAGTRVATNHYLLGDTQLPASKVGEDLRRRLGDGIAQTARFLLLDRALAPELQEEIAFINSGQARLEDIARVGQQLAADLLLVSSVERFEYKRHVRQLRMSERELVSYAGGGTVNVKLVNATTGELVFSRTFDVELKPLEASTQGRFVDGDAVARELVDKIADQVLQAVLESIFPVSVVAMSGTQLVLSQGGSAVREGKSYELMQLGDVLVDPQTGRSLGRVESPAGVVRIDRVAGQTAYATLVQSNLPDRVDFYPGMLELRKEIPVSETWQTVPPSGDVDRMPAPDRAPSPARERNEAKDDKNW